MSVFTRLRTIKNQLANNRLLRLNNVECGHNVKINGEVYIRNRGGKIEIGDNTVLNSGLIYNPIGGQERMTLVCNHGGAIIIGNGCGISNSSFFAFSEIKIEDNVFIGGGCKIYDSDFHSLNYDKRISSADDDIQSKPIIVRGGAFIGAHSLILKGVTIGERSIIGAGSVVTKDVPDREIWAGNPAKFIRKID